MGEVSHGLDSRALAVVQRCLDHDPETRDALIESECVGDPALAARVRTLLSMEEAAPDLLATRAIESRHGGFDRIPERVGKYRVTGLIGRGGMGMVLRAERDDGVYSQDVAIKLIGAHLRSEADRERFATERRLLARLSHPGIARILDGGEQDGRPWLAMELVEGEAVTLDLRDRGAGVGETLDVFEAVAEAVSHAHRNLVIHGDIKPSNILRTRDGAVKLLDFGIGRMAETEVGAQSYPLTPTYAAPERKKGAAPSVAGDVYSLTVLLYEMIAGRLPEEGPPRLDARAAKIAPLPARADLEALLERGLEPDPERRYPDVAALVADLDRYRHFRPVQARAAGAGHRARLFVRRYRLGLAIASAFALLLAVATAIALSLYVDAGRQRATAERRFADLRSLAGFQLFELYDSLAETPGTTAARARLATEAQHYLDRLGLAPDAPDDLRLDIARGLNRLAEVQGLPRVPNLGQPDRARANLARAGTILEALAAAQPSDRAVARERARNLVHRAQIATWLDFRTETSGPLLERAEPLLAEGDTADREVAALYRTAVLDRLGWDEDYAALRDAAGDGLRWLERWPDPRPLSWHLARADALNARGDALYYLGDRSGALAAYRQAATATEAAARRWPRRAALLARRTMSAYNLLSARAETERAATLVEPARAIVRSGEALIALEPNDVALRRRQTIARELAAQILDRAGRRDEAIDLQRAVVAERAALSRRAVNEAREARDLAFSQSVLGTLNWNAGHRREACRAWDDSRIGFGRLARQGRLNRFDRDRSLAYVLFNLEICSGRRPASAFRSPA